MNLEETWGFLEKLRQLEREIGWQLESDTECCGVTLTQCHIILEIGKTGESSVVDLATVLGLDTSTLSYKGAKERRGISPLPCQYLG